MLAGVFFFFFLSITLDTSGFYGSYTVVCTVLHLSNEKAPQFYSKAQAEHEYAAWCSC